jgi:sigma-54 dependent transcriptional regulator, gfr operon transcriptional activator
MNRKRLKKVKKMLKDDLLDYLSENTALFQANIDMSIFTAAKLCTHFEVKRNTVSHYLNQLVDEGALLKINTRPVYFIHRAVFEDRYFIVSRNIFHSFEDLFSLAPDEKPKDAFSELIGSEESLKKAINQIKTSVYYPPNGLPILISGPTGVGKSFLAKLVHQYCKEQGILQPDAPFINFNCAQYFNNPELLSSNLFGHVKGAFTGAEKTKPGMLEMADRGILFLDEVHRLDQEGQEKLFTFMDQGLFRRMGESDGWHKSNVRLIFATTEDLSQYFLKTFLRRVPIIVNLPGLDERDVREKQQFIYQFLISESKLLSRNIRMSKRVMDLLMDYSYTGNIGELQNTIKYLCAAAYMEDRDDEVLTIHLKDLPEKLLKAAVSVGETRADQNRIIEIKLDMRLEDYVKKEKPYCELIKYTYQEIYDLFRQVKLNKITPVVFETDVYQQINVLLDKLIFDRYPDDSVIMQFTTASVQEIFRYIEFQYQTQFNGNSIFAISYYLYLKDHHETVWNDDYIKLRKELYQFVLNDYQEEFKLSRRLITLIESKMDIHLTLDDEIFLTFYIKSLSIQSGQNIARGLILAHGYSTASSISNVVNRMLGTNIFEAFDMPLDSDVKEISERVALYIEQNDVSKGLVILVDMGSLEDIYSHVKHLVSGPVAIINNVTTQMALFVGEMVLKNYYMEEIIERLKVNHQTDYQIIYPEKVKQQAILITCATGVGTAVQIQKLIENSVPEALGIKIVVHDYERLKHKETKEALLQLYHVLMVIGTDNPNLEGISFISLEDLISGRGEEKLERVFRKVLDPMTIQLINNNIVRNFSLKRVIESLTILDSDKVIDHIEKFIATLERLMNKRLTNDKRISLLVHLSCLVERLIRQAPIKTYPEMKSFEENHKETIKVIKNAARMIEDIYNIEINTAEIGYIYNILSAKSLVEEELN